MAPINVLVDAPEQLPQIPQQSSARDRLPPSGKVLPDKRKNVAASLLHPPGDVPSVPKTSSLDLPLKAPGVPEGPPPELLDNTESEEVGIPVNNVENAAEENDFSVSPQSWKIFSDDGPHCPPSGDHDSYSTGFQKDADKHLLASRQSLAENANASPKKANTETIDATRADVAGIGHSGSIALQADGASIDHSSSPTCESADDGKCSTLTPGTPPERRADQDEVALAVAGSATDRSDGDQLDQSSEVPSKNFKNSDVERSYGGIHVAQTGMETSAPNCCNKIVS
ncbi:hypothetical protein HPB52_006314 [Rhipicephalus sanguineus]|uniref:Uncharacterized protein n=1 Tax=Rhipicephalus sanguineus TaxID=34632 RepID=A0A9D4PQW1_RHISA|nr:hypothetical protein HPB52_006314 [Rhipicephalus sanguineus]